MPPSTVDPSPAEVPAPQSACCQNTQPTSESTCCQSGQTTTESAPANSCCAKPTPPSPPQAKVPKKRFGGRSALVGKEGKDGGSALTAHAPRPRRTLNAIPQELLDDPDLAAAHSLLPSTYNFELPKTIHFLRQHSITRLALQLPEGLLIFACTISDILTKFVPGLETVIMGDVTYGACCVDDFTARALGCQGLVHYAHSCLVPQDRLGDGVKVLYVFVGMEVDVPHLVATVEKNLTPASGTRPKLALVGTIQFNAGLAQTRNELAARGWDIDVPQAMPLSKGEVLGCTAPRLASDIDALLYIGDGRFHLESAMIMNPGTPAYRYDPYSRRFTKEEYEHTEMKTLRATAIQQAKSAKKWGLILGTLGRQGNIATLENLERLLSERGTPYVILLLSEIFPGKLAMMEEVEAWVQVACPRLSIDWGYAFPRPLLSPYEAMVVLGQRELWTDVYPMDFYAKDGLGRTRRRVEGVA